MLSSLRNVKSTLGYPRCDNERERLPPFGILECLKGVSKTAAKKFLSNDSQSLPSIVCSQEMTKKSPLYGTAEDVA